MFQHMHANSGTTMEESLKNTKKANNFFCFKERKAFEAGNANILLDTGHFT